MQGCGERRRSFVDVVVQDRCFRQSASFVSFLFPPPPIPLGQAISLSGGWSDPARTHARTHQVLLEGWRTDGSKERSKERRKKERDQIGGVYISREHSSDCCILCLLFFFFSFFFPLCGVALHNETQRTSIALVCLHSFFISITFVRSFISFLRPSVHSVVSSSSSSFESAFPSPRLHPPPLFPFHHPHTSHAMEVHRCRFVDYVPAAINALTFTPVSTRPLLACGRANGDIELWNPKNDWTVEKVPSPLHPLQKICYPIQDPSRKSHSWRISPNEP